MTVRERDRAQSADDQEGRTTDGRRRRGTRGGRGRGAREAEPVRAPVAVEPPKIVGRRPGRPAVGPAAEATPAAPAPPPGAAAAAAPAAAAVQPARRRAPRAAAEPSDLSALLAEQQQLLGEIREELHELREQVALSARRARLGVFVDVPNLLYGAERGDRALDMGKLLAYLADGRELVRATAYAPVSDNPAEPVQQQRFVAPFVPHQYRIVTKPLKRFADGSIKGNFDVEMAVDMLTMADRLDVVAIVSGDADFARVVEEIQSRGVRVEVVAFAGSTSAEMRALADRYIEVGAIAHELR